MKLAHAVLIIAFFPFVQGALAQDYMGMFNASNAAGINITGTIATNAAIKKQAKNAARNKRSRVGQKAAKTRVPSAKVPKLSFTPDPRISKRVKEQFRVAVQRADPAKAEHIAVVLAAQDVLADFDRDMTPFGLRSNNLADAMTAYWIAMWMVANRTEVPGKGSVAAARAQVRANLKSNNMAVKASRAQIQKITEGLIYETMFALGQRADAERRDDARRARELAEHTQRNIRKNGVDLQALRLTRSGFVKK